MKKSYTTPTLTVHGTVEEITQAFGSSAAQDTVYFGDFGLPPIPGQHGSQDGIVVPTK